MSHPKNMKQATPGGGAFGFVRNGYEPAEHNRLSTSEIENANVYGRNDETIGSIRALKVGKDGKIRDAVIEVGGFLGIGAHAVVIPFEDLTILRETNGTDVRVHLDTNTEQLEALPPYDG